jgi:hypothetical protein
VLAPSIIDVIQLAVQQVGLPDERISTLSRIQAAQRRAISFCCRRLASSSPSSSILKDFLSVLSGSSEAMNRGSPKKIQLTDP